MTDSVAKAEARAKVAVLVNAFKRNEADYLSSAYNETQARTDFISPLLAAFGWDVYNTKGYQLALRETIEEATVEVGKEGLHKKPDYELRLTRQRKLFIEAKRPSIPIHTEPASAFQIRRYGFSASLPISVLTNFRHLAIYDCRTAPKETDAANVCRLLLVSYEEFDTRFDDLWMMLSRESIYSGEFDREFGVASTRRGAEQFDDIFLQQVCKWRECLAFDIYRHTPGLTSDELTYVVQLFLSRIIFLRICEDRDIEKYERLRYLDERDAFSALMRELRRADAFYNSGLFRLAEDAGLEVQIGDATVFAIISELYYPASPYTFAVVEPEVLGEIYEHFLGDVIEIDQGRPRIVNKPEVRESGAVISTPRYIADAIAERTLRPLLNGKSPTDLEDFTIADICCGSGSFLLAAFQILLDHYLTWYLSHDRDAHDGQRIYESVGNQWRLTFDERRRILVAHIRGVDIDPNAVEITQFSLLLKLIEGETAEALQDYVDQTMSPALPPLDTKIRSGNSLVSLAEWRRTYGVTPIDDQINPLNWESEYRNEMRQGGFDAVICNPPYVRIQNMARYSPSEVRFFQNHDSPYTTAEHDNFDKYLLFVERSIGLIKKSGRIGMIIPHKFMTIQSGRALRRLITRGRLLDEIVHFGAKQVFGPDVTNYTCILVLDRMTRDRVCVERPGRLESWRYGKPGAVSFIDSNDLGDDPWRFADSEATALLDRIRTTFSETLDTVSEIFVGLQTSADAIYIFEAVAEDAEACTLHWNDRDWSIERGILRRCLLDVPLSEFVRPQSNTWIIFPYDLVQGPGGSVRARLIQPCDMMTRFPGCWAYLNARRAELEGRSITGGRAGERQWYQYGRSQSLTKFDREKIILPILSRGPCYAYDDRNVLVTGGGNGPYYLIRPRSRSGVSTNYLLAVLNHPISEAFVRIHTSVFRGGYYSHGKQFIKTLPIPIPSNVKGDEIEALVKMLIGRLDALAFVRTPDHRSRLIRKINELRQEIQQHVSQVYGITENEFDIVNTIPIPD